MSYAELTQAFHDTHHQQECQIVHRLTIWVNNLTNEPCSQRPCYVCQRLHAQGYQLLSEPVMQYNTHLSPQEDQYEPARTE